MAGKDEYIARIETYRRVKEMQDSRPGIIVLGIHPIILKIDTRVAINVDSMLVVEVDRMLVIVE